MLENYLLLDSYMLHYFTACALQGTDVHGGCLLWLGGTRCDLRFHRDVYNRSWGSTSLLQEHRSGQSPN